jgi:hypothetical protein
MDGTEAGGVDEGELGEVDHHEGSGRTGQVFAEVPHGRCIELPTHGDDVTSVEGMGSDAKEIRCHAPPALLLVGPAVTP